MALHSWEWDYDGKRLDVSRKPWSTMTLYQCDPDVSNEEGPQAMWSNVSKQQIISPFYSISTEEIMHSDIPQVVPCTFTICLALPSCFGSKKKISPEKFKRFKADKLAKLRRFYHMEYKLLPNDRDPKQVDMVLFSTVIAKLFMESGVKTVNPWCENDKVWVCWKETHKLAITKEVLKKLNYHKVTFNVWDNKEKLCRKAKFAKVKSFSRQEDFDGFDEAKQMVLRQRKFSEDKMPKPSVIKTKTEIIKVEPYVPATEVDSEQDFLAKIDPEFDKALRGEDFNIHWTFSKEQSIAREKSSENKEASKRVSTASLSTGFEKTKMQIKGRNMLRRIPFKKKKLRAMEEEESEIALNKKGSIFSMQLDVMPLLAGQKTVMSHTDETTCKVLDCFLNLTVDGPLMTEKQKKDLNPLTIKIKSVASLPLGPVPLQQMQKMCVPVYCRYKFHNTPVHQTKGQPHGTHVYFEDVNVILMGALDPQNLREYLEGPPMEVEVHDRDRKTDTFLGVPSLFGEDPGDVYLSNSNQIPSKYTIENPFETASKSWDPYGVAKVSFADLLLGQKLMELFIPIHCCEPDTSDYQNEGKDGKKVFGSNKLLDPRSSPMPKGNYFESSSLLKLRIELCMPLKLGEDELAHQRFGRIIYVFDSSKIKFLRHLLKGIIEINAKALHFESYTLRDIEEMFSAFKVKVKVQENLNLDVLTGFHLLDGKIHLFILEGLAQQGVRKLWEKFSSRPPDLEDGNFQVFYNSELLFHQRLYAELDSLLFHVHLCKPLSSLVKQSSFYVRGSIPQPSFQALIKLDCICHSSRLRDIIRRDLFPSAEMIKSMNQDFGLPLSREDLSTPSPVSTAPSVPIKIERPEKNEKRLRSVIEQHQENYLQWKKDMELKQAKAQNYIRRNITEASLVKRNPVQPEVRMIRIVPTDGKSVYNYSIQNLNSGELAKQKLFAQMNEQRGKQFTYSKEFLSTLPEPVVLFTQDPGSKYWLTPEGFQFPGHRSSFDSNQHPKKLDQSRVEELKEIWQENSLFANIMKPVLNRERMSWDDRYLDFDIYKKPPLTLGLPRHALTDEEMNSEII